MITEEQMKSAHDTKIKSIRASYLERREISPEEYHSQLNAEADDLKAKIRILESR